MKNIVFDLGRVLLDYQPLVWLKKKNYTHYNELFEIVFQNPSWIKLDEGTITREEFTEKLINGKTVIENHDVTEIIDILGHPDQFDNNDNEKIKNKKDEKKEQRKYR